MQMKLKRNSGHYFPSLLPQRCAWRQKREEAKVRFCENGNFLFLFLISDMIFSLKSHSLKN